MVIDVEHVITHCSRAYERLTGIPAEGMIGTRNQWRTFLSEPGAALLDLIVDQAPEAEIMARLGPGCRKAPLAEDAWEAERFLPAPEGGGKWYLFTAVPLKHENGRVAGAVETFREVTKGHRMQDALRRTSVRLQTLVDFIPYPIGVFTMDGHPTYLNPYFTKVFGWTLEDFQAGRVPFVPFDQVQNTLEELKRLRQDKILVHHESKRLTRDGRMLDVSIRAAAYAETVDGLAGVIAIYRDITNDKRMARIQEAMLQISLALPKYPDLQDLLHFINTEVKDLVESEGCVVILPDEEKRELYITGAAYDQDEAIRRAAEVRFRYDQLMAGEVIRTGEPMIVSDTSKNKGLHEERDRKLGYKTRNLALVPLKGRNRIKGAICAINKRNGDFKQEDIELLEMVAGTVAVVIAYAQVSDKLKSAYNELLSMNKAKDKMINHLSHELRTPLAVLMSTMTIFSRKLKVLPEAEWAPTMERARRNLNRLVEIQRQAEDILMGGSLHTHDVMTLLLEECADELEALTAEEVGEGKVVRNIRSRIDELFGPKTSESEEIRLDTFVRERIHFLQSRFGHRQVKVDVATEAGPSVWIPRDVLEKLVDGLVRNAVENTPDEGKIEVLVHPRGNGMELVVHDYGVGIPEEAKRRIFEGFFTTGDTLSYSSKRPFDFNAGGKGADLLRMKMFSQRYGFDIQMTSTRCGHLLEGTCSCPGEISRCPFCSSPEDCYESGETAFFLYFPLKP